MSRINLEDSVLERPIIRTGLKYGVTILPGTANATLDSDMGPIISMATTGARTLTLPTISVVDAQGLKGLTFYIVNGGANVITVNNAAAAAVAAVPASIGATGMFVFLGDLNL